MSLVKAAVIGLLLIRYSHYTGTRRYGRDSPRIGLHHSRQGWICPVIVWQTFGQEVCQFLSLFGICKKVLSTRAQNKARALFWALLSWSRLQLLEYLEQP